MPISADTEVFHALTKSKDLAEEDFRLRPNEDSLSIATSLDKAMGSLTCKGYAVLAVGRIEAIQGLRVQVKRNELQPDPQQPDEELLEVIGLPLIDANQGEIRDYAAALIKAVVRFRSFPKRMKLDEYRRSVHD